MVVSAWSGSGSSGEEKEVGGRGGPGLELDSGYRVTAL